ncbi:MAG TPA: phage holin family protein [Rhodocyclaceae bacterium]|nr:phage holin family protein [Rhodocyclaceae bacterium]
MSQEVKGEDTAGLSLRGFFLAGIRLAHNRLQILATEVAEEKVRLTLAAITGVSGLFFLGLAVVLATILLLVLFWDNHRVEVLAGLSAAFALLGGGLLALTVRAVTQKVPPFQATLGELKKDQDAWRAAEDHH